MDRRPDVMMIAGEVSGDRQGSLLAAALRRQRPEMAAAGVDVLADSTRWGVIGYAEAYARLPVFALRYRRLVGMIERLRPRALVLIDFPGMNRELVRRFSGRVPMVYYFPPQTYGRRGRSAARMARHAVRLLAVLPFEADAYRRAGADVVFIGHPAVDTPVTAPRPDVTLRSKWGVGDEPLIGLLPGSRVQNIRYLLPPMLAAARRLRAAHRAQFVLPVASPHLQEVIQREVARSGVPVRLLGGSRDAASVAVMAAADVIVVASGTATVEAACVGVPMVVVLRVSRLTAWIAHRFAMPAYPVRAGYSTPSVALGRPVVPELIQDAVTGPRISMEVGRVLTDAGLRQRISEDLAEVRRRLGPPGVLDRAAAEVSRVLDSPMSVALG
jgi:lipid-A-disaccharide synthase